METIKEKLNIQNLVIEVTRKCNMQCDHCLRGDSQDINMATCHIDALLSQLDYISCVVFTGGEPTLNTKAIKYFLDACKLMGIGIGSFYIATNGKDVTEEFVLTCLRLYAYCDDNEITRVDVSNDYYHEGNYDTTLLDGLSFFGRKNEKENDDYGKGRYLIDEGMANENGIAASGRTLEGAEKIETVDDFQDTQIYLNCRGDIIAGCNYSYERQEDNIICPVHDLLDFYHGLDKE